MKKILVTTKLLKVNEEKISKLWDAKLNVNNEIYSENQLIELSKDCDGILSSILDKIDKDTKNGGATITNLMGTSAYYSPAASITELVECIIHDSKKVLSCSTLLNGENSIHNKCIGVPVIIGGNGIEKIMNYDLDNEELLKLQK